MLTISEAIKALKENNTIVDSYNVEYKMNSYKNSYMNIEEKWYDNIIEEYETNIISCSYFISNHSTDKFEIKKENH